MKGPNFHEKKTWLLPENILLFAAIALFAALWAVLLIAKIEYGGKIRVSVNALIPFMIAVALGYIGCLLHVRRTGNQSVLRAYFWVLFVLYLLLLSDFTLFNVAFGRGSESVYRQTPTREYYLQMFTNFKPFESIFSVYFKQFREGRINSSYLALNLLGNLCAFMPLSFFLPVLFKSQRKFYLFFPTVLLFGVGIEAAQFVSMRGSCDVDDVILNVSGAVILYFVLKIPPLRRLEECFVSGRKMYICQ